MRISQTRIVNGKKKFEFRYPRDVIRGRINGRTRKKKANNMDRSNGHRS